MAYSHGFHVSLLSGSYMMDLKGMKLGHSSSCRDYSIHLSACAMASGRKYQIYAARVQYLNAGLCCPWGRVKYLRFSDRHLELYLTLLKSISLPLLPTCRPNHPSDEPTRQRTASEPHYAERNTIVLRLCARHIFFSSPTYEKFHGLQHFILNSLL